MGPFNDIGVEKAGHVALVEIRRPPNNFFDVALIKEIASAFEAFDADADCRALVLAAREKRFAPAPISVTATAGGNPQRTETGRGQPLHRRQPAVPHQ